MVFLFSLFSSAALAQSKPVPGAPVPPDTITRPGSIQDTGLYNYWNQMSGQGRAGGALLGKLAVEGEPMPWEPILVTVTCDGKVAYATQTDANGNFGIVGVVLQGAQGKASDSERQMETHYEGCLVQGDVAGFRSTAITITQRNLRDDPQLGTIMLSRIGGRDLPTTLSATSKMAPANAVKAFEKARGDMMENKPDAAEKDLHKAAQIDQGFAEAWFQLGKLQEASDPREAKNSFSKALAADPKFVLPYEQLGALAAQANNWQETLDDTNHVLQLYPQGTAQAWYLNALANYQLGMPDKAEASAIKSLDIDPRHSVMNTEQLLAVILAGKGDFAGALEHLRSSLTYVPPGPNADLLKQQIAQLEQHAAK
jgi:tetratricopeptide (TPR) repeat protein